VRQFLNIFIILLFICSVFSFALTPIRSDNDVWWHVKTGKIITENGFSLPKYDILAYTSESIPWHNHEWLAQVAFYFAYRLGDGTEQGGFRMVILLTALLLVVACGLVAALTWRETGSVPIAVLAGLLALLLSRRTIYPRPPVFSYALFAGWLFILREVESGRIKRHWLWVLPVIMIPWANLHGGFILGIIALGAYLAADVWRILVQWRFNAVGRETNVVMNAVILVACLVASLINPYGYNLYLLPGRVMGDAFLVRIIPELHSPDFYYTLAFEALILFLVASGFILKKKVITIPEGLLIIFFMHEGLQHVRHLPLVGIVSAPVCGRIVAALVEEIPYPRLKPLLPDLFIFAAVLIIGWSVMNHREGESFIDRNLRYFDGEGYYEENYPVAEANFIVANNFTGRMFNQINEAGFLIWRLSPEYHKVFTDDRYDVFGGLFMRQEQIIQNGIDRKVSFSDQTWDELLDYWRVNFIVITADAPVNGLLENDGRWAQVYHRLPPNAISSREGYKIYVRNLPGNKDLIERCHRSFQAIYGLQRNTP